MVRRGFCWIGTIMMHRIVNNLWLGGQQDADELVRNNPQKITAILNVRGSDAYDPPGRDQAGEHPGKAYRWIPAPDVGILYPKHVKEAVAWLQEQADKGARILVHCRCGVSRAPGFLAAFMVASGISASVEEATAAICVHRSVSPAPEAMEVVKRRVLTSELTGLPNRLAFDEGPASAFVAIAYVDLLKPFNDFYGYIAGDALLRRLGKTLVSAGLDVYHDRGNEFLCKGESRQELEAKLSRARQIFQEPFQLYGGGRIQTVEETDFSYWIGTGLEEEPGLHKLKQAIPRNESPEWLRKMIGAGGYGHSW